MKAAGEIKISVSDLEQSIANLKRISDSLQNRTCRVSLSVSQGGETKELLLFVDNINSLGKSVNELVKRVEKKATGSLLTFKTIDYDIAKIFKE